MVGDNQTTTIAQVVPRLNRDILLPGIQREFVWDDEQIVQLFDSVLREYHIGSLLLWRVRDDFAEKQVKYRFIKDYIESSTFPAEFVGDVVNHNQKVFDEDQHPNDLLLALDGQQRLTSFLIGLKGSYMRKQPRRQYNNPDAWDRTYLYINLLSDPDVLSGDDMKMKYEFEFKEKDPEQSASEYWYRVGNILDVSDAVKESQAIASEIGSDQVDRIMRNLADLHQAIHQRAVITYKEETTEDEERVLDQFIRVNEGGEVLSKSEILLSIATGHWTGEDANSGEGLDARENINNFIDNVNSEFAEEGYHISIDFVLKSLLALAGCQMKYDISNFTRENLDKMKAVWTDDDKFQKSVINSFDLLSEFGIQRRSLTSKKSVIPIVYYLYVNDVPYLDAYSSEDRYRRRQLHYYLCSAILNNSFSSQTDELVQKARSVIDEAESEEFPLEPIHDEVRDQGKAAGFDELTATRLVEEVTYGHIKAPILLSLVHYRDSIKGNPRMEIDHVIEKQYLKWETLMDDYGFSAEEATQIDSKRDNIANLQLLTDEEHGKKNETGWDQWLQSRTDDYFEDHCLPKDDSLYEVENFEEFLQQRKKLMREYLVGLHKEMES